MADIFDDASAVKITQGLGKAIIVILLLLYVGSFTLVYGYIFGALSGGYSPSGLSLSFLAWPAYPAMVIAFVLFLPRAIKVFAKASTSNIGLAFSIAGVVLIAIGLLSLGGVTSVIQNWDKFGQVGFTDAMRYGFLIEFAIFGAAGFLLSFIGKIINQGSIPFSALVSLVLLPTVILAFWFTLLMNAHTLIYAYSGTTVQQNLTQNFAWVASDVVYAILAVVGLLMLRMLSGNPKGLETPAYAVNAAATVFMFVAIVVFVLALPSVTADAFNGFKNLGQVWSRWLGESLVFGVLGLAVLKISSFIYRK